MNVFDASNGFQLTHSRIFNGVTLSHLKQARLRRDKRRTLGDHYVELLWGYFENPHRATVQEQVVLIEADEGRNQSGLQLWSSYRSSKPLSTFVGDEEVTALRELYEHLEGQLPKEAM